MASVRASHDVLRSCSGPSICEQRLDVSKRKLMWTAACLAAFPFEVAAQQVATPAQLPPVTVEQKTEPKRKSAKTGKKRGGGGAASSAQAAPSPEPTVGGALGDSDALPNGPGGAGSKPGTVSDSGPRDYKVENLTSPKFTQPILDTPRSVQVVTKALLDVQNAQKFEDVLRNVPGISLQAGEGNPPAGNQFKIRGFSAAGDTYIDGVRDPGFYFRDTFNTEGVEIVKGPGSADFGRGSTGGAINIVSKKPQNKTFSEIEGTVGDGLDSKEPVKRLAVDVNSKLTGIDGAIRLNAIAHDGGVPGREHVENERLGFAPSLTLGLRSPTTINLSYQYFSYEGLPDAGIPLGRAPLGLSFTGRVPPVNYSNFYGYLNRDYTDIEQHLATVSLDHKFSGNFKAGTRLRYGHLENDTIISSPRIVNETTAFGQTKPRDQVDDVVISQTDATAKITTFGARHTIVAGTEFAYEKAENRRRLDTPGNATTIDPATGRPFNPPLDLFNPDNSVAASGNPYNGTRARIQSYTSAVYLRDTLELSKQWILNGGIRFDHIETDVNGFRPLGSTYGNNLVNGRSSLSASRTDNEWSWNAGLTYKPVSFGSIYASYGTSFEPVGSLGLSGAGNYQLAGGGNSGPVEIGFYADPETNESYEIGTKWDVLDNRLSLAAAIFRTDKRNVRNININDRVAIDGEQRIDGFEITAAGALTPAWRIFAGYTFLDSEILESTDPARPEGSEIDNVPRNSFNLWTSYLLPFGLELGAGVTYVGERTSLGNGTNQVAVLIDDYWRFDAAASYPVDEVWSLQLNLRNLANERYIEAIQQGGGQGVPGEAFSALVSLKARFGDK